MRAAQITGYGEIDVIKVQEAATPNLAPGQVLIEVHAASLNPFDTSVRKGFARQVRELNFPATIGGDFAGVVRELGEGVEGLVVGDAVYGQASLFRAGSGSFAECAAAPSSAVAAKPKNLTFIEAAAVPLTGVSAWQALTEHMHLGSNQKVLIHGGAGGIGTLAIQIAKHLGAYVATTVATDEVGYAKNLGADLIIDYKTEKFEERVQGFDAVYDTVAGETYTRSFTVLRPGGIIVSMLEQPNQELMERYQVTAIAQQTKITTEKLERLAELLEKGVVHVHVDRVFPLEETADAFTYRETGHPRGKVVVEVRA